MKIYIYTLITSLTTCACMQNPITDNQLKESIKETDKNRVHAAEDYIAENKINANDNANVQVVNHGSYISIDNSVNLSFGLSYTKNKTSYREYNIEKKINKEPKKNFSFDFDNTTSTIEELNKKDEYIETANPNF